MSTEFRGEMFGIRIIERPGVPNDAVLIICEDDGNWFPKGEPFDAGWIDDLVKHLLLAKLACKITFKPSPSDIHMHQEKP